MYDSVCGCDVASHDVSTLEGEVLKEGEERGFDFALQWWYFPSGSCYGVPDLPKCLPGDPPQLPSHCLALGAELR